MYVCGNYTLIWSGLVNHRYNYYIAIALASEYASGFKHSETAYPDIRAWSLAK